MNATMKSITMIIMLMLVVSILPIATAAKGETQITNTKYIKLDNNFNIHRLSVDITLKEPGKLVYVENFYKEDSKGEPKYYSNSRVDIGSVAGAVTINIVRPKHYYGSSYRYIEKLIIVNGKITERVWLDYRPYY